MKRSMRFAAVMMAAVMTVGTASTAMAAEWKHDSKAGGGRMMTEVIRQLPGSGLMAIMMVWLSAIILIRQAICSAIRKPQMVIR